MMASEQPSTPDQSQESGGESRSQPGVPPPLRKARAAVRGRLHPLTFLFVLWNTIRGFFIPAVVVLIVGADNALAFLLLIMMAIALAQGVFRYFTFEYRIENGELITRQGLIEKTERNIPLARVQDLRLDQGLLHRLLGMVDVHVETAGGAGTEATLSVLSTAEAGRLRAAVFEAVEQGRRPVAGEERPQSEVVRKLSLKELVLAGLTSNQMASSLVVVFAILGVVEDFRPEMYQRVLESIGGRIDMWREQAGSAAWIHVVIGTLAVIAVGLAISVSGSVLLFHNFTLARVGEDLHRSYGLFTRRSSSLPRRRIQLVKIEEGWLRRVFGLAALRADTAGVRPGEQTSKREGRDMLMPVLNRAEVEGVLPYLLIGIDKEPLIWNKVSPIAVRRGTAKGSLVCIAAAALLFLFSRQVSSIWPLALIPIVYVTNLLNYRHLGYALSDHYFRARRGWISRSTYIVPIRNVQLALLRQTPFDRHHRVASIMIDTAGQAYTGGAPRIDNIPIEEARALAWALGKRAATVKFQWG